MPRSQQPVNRLVMRRSKSRTSRTGGILSAPASAFPEKTASQRLCTFSRFASDHRFVKFPLPCCTAMQYLLPEWSLGAVRWELQSAGMVRVVNAEAALRAARYLGGGSATLRLHDAQIEENNACFAVQFENGRAISVSRSDTQPDAELEISTFSALLCGVCDFSEARQYFPGLEVFHESAPLDRVFFRKPLYIEDYF